MRLQGNVAMVTGAGQGIGYAIAERYLEEGASVVIAEIDEQRGGSAIERLADWSDRVAFVPTDVTDEESAAAAVAEAVSRFGRLDILVNNAALFHDIDNRDNSYEYLKRVYETNLLSVWLMSRAVAPTLVEQGSGRIINIGSIAGYLYESPARSEFKGLNAYAYGQTKWGVTGLTKFIAGQLGQYGILVNCVAPGVTLTEATAHTTPQVVQDHLVAKSTLRRPLEPRDITGAAVFFASDDASMVTGQVLFVDAGLVASG